MKHLLTGVSTIAIMAATGSTLAADLLPRAVAPVHAAHWTAHGQRESGSRTRAPLLEPFELGERQTEVVAATQPNARDSHVLEFLRWKAQQNGAISREPAR
jgi:hypothetical protein